MEETIRSGGWGWWCGGETPRDRRNQARLLWTLGDWAVCDVGGSKLIRAGLVPPGPVSWALAALPMLFAALAVLAYARFLREADELNRMIHLKALALGFGGGWFAVVGYQVFELAGAPVIDRSGIIVVMVVLYSVGIVLGRVRYH